MCRCKNKKNINKKIKKCTFKESAKIGTFVRSVILTLNNIDTIGYIFSKILALYVRKELF